MTAPPSMVASKAAAPSATARARASGAAPPRTANRGRVRVGRKRRGIEVGRRHASGEAKRGRHPRRRRLAVRKRGASEGRGRGGKVTVVPAAPAAPAVCRRRTEAPAREFTGRQGHATMVKEQEHQGLAASDAANKARATAPSTTTPPKPAPPSTVASKAAAPSATA